MAVSGAATASFLYDGDGARVKSTVGGVTTYYPNQYYEVAGGVVKKYCYAGANRVAMNDGGATRILLGDHLGSTAVTVAGTTELGEVRYRAFGATRFTSGTTPTTFRYTGQREESSFGLYYYGARWYDPALGHFVQPDTIIPNAGNALDYHRYGYARFNPLKYNDPTGHSCNMMETMGVDSVGFLVDCSVGGGGGGGISRGATGATGAAGGLGAAAALNAGLATGAPPIQAESPAPMLESVPGQVAGAASTSFPLADDGPTTSIPASTSVFNNTMNVLADPLPVVEPTGHLYTSQSDHEVYVVRNPTTGQIVIYVGRTSQGLAAREKQHRDTLGREGWELESVRQGLTLEEARNYEQELIIRYGLNNLENKRNEIASNKWSDYLQDIYRQLRGDK